MHRKCDPNITIIIFDNYQAFFKLGYVRIFSMVKQKALNFLVISTKLRTPTL